MNFPPIPDTFSDAPKARVVNVPPGDALAIASFTKRDDEQIDYDFNYGRWLTAVERVTSAVAVVVPPDPSVSVATQINANGTVAKLWVTGGIAGMRYTVSMVVTTDGARVKEEEFISRIASERLASGDPEALAESATASAIAAAESAVQAGADANASADSAAAALASEQAAGASALAASQQATAADQIGRAHV